MGAPTVRLWVVTALGIGAAAGCAPPSDPLAPERVPRLGGASVTVQLRDAARSSLQGELVTVSDDSLWVLSGPLLAGAPLASVAEIRVRRHGYTARRTLTWGAVGALVTGGGLAAACSSVGCNGAGAVFLAMALTWTVVTVPSALGNEQSSNAQLPSVTAAALRPYARFPQGWPPALPRGDLGAERD